MRKNCSSDRENIMKFEAKSREFAIILRSLEQFFLTVGQNNFANKIPFQIHSISDSFSTIVEAWLISESSLLNEGS